VAQGHLFARALAAGEAGALLMRNDLTAVPATLGE